MSQGLQQHLDRLGVLHSAVQRAAVQAIFSLLDKDETFNSRAGRRSLETCLTHSAQVRILLQTWTHSAQPPARGCIIRSILPPSPFLSESEADAGRWSCRKLFHVRLYFSQEQVELCIRPATVSFAKWSC